MISFVLLFTLAFSQTCTDCASPRTCQFKAGSTTESECVCPTGTPIYDVTDKTCVAQKTCEDNDNKVVVGKECQLLKDCSTNTDGTIVNLVAENKCIKEDQCTGDNVLVTARKNNADKKLCMKKKTCSGNEAYYFEPLNICLPSCVSELNVEQVTNANTCKCKTNYVPNPSGDPLCVCPENTHVVINNECQAKADCSSQITNKYRNPITNVCVANCENIKAGTDYIELGNECVVQAKCTDTAKPVYFEDQNTCISREECPQKSTSEKTYFVYTVKINGEEKVGCAVKPTCKDSESKYFVEGNICVGACADSMNVVAGTDANTCKCKPNYVFDAAKPGKCECPSPNVEAEENGQKKCEAKVDCSSQTTNKYRNPITNKCVANCENIKAGTDYTELGNECVVEAKCTAELPYYFEQENKCITEATCTGKSTNDKTYIVFNMKVGTTEKKVCVEKKKCDATKYYLPFMNDCVERCPAENNFVADNAKTCSCKTNYVLNTGSNPIKCECPANTHVVVGNECQAKKDCSKQETNKNYDAATNTCVKDCPKERPFVNNNKVCEAKPDCSKEATNKNYDGNTNKCVKDCPKERPVVISNECKAKPDCSQDTSKPLYDSKTNTCVACPKDKPKYNKDKKECYAENNGVNGLFVILAMALFFIF